MITNALMVGLGGMVGCMARFLASSLTQKLAPSLAFPLGTLLVNVLGCFFIGLLMEGSRLNEGARLFLVVGLLGGFTTFSAFGYETLEMLGDRGRTASAIGNVLVSVVAGLAAVWIGSAVSRALMGSGQ